MAAVGPGSRGHPPPTTLKGAQEAREGALAVLGASHYWHTGTLARIGYSMLGRSTVLSV